MIDIFYIYEEKGEKKKKNKEFKDIEIGDGGVICNHDKLLPLQNNFRVIPINYI